MTVFVDQDLMDSGVEQDKDELFVQANGNSQIDIRVSQKPTEEKIKSEPGSGRSRNKCKDKTVSDKKGTANSGPKLVNQAFMTLMEQNMAQSRDYDSIFYEFYESHGSSQSARDVNQIQHADQHTIEVMEKELKLIQQQTFEQPD